MNKKFRRWVQHDHINDTTLRCDLIEYHYWSCEGKKTPTTRFCTCLRCKEYKENLRKQMISRIKKYGRKKVLKELGEKPDKESIWDNIEAA